MGINVKLKGVIFNGAQENIKRFAYPGVGTYTLVREPDNQYDENAIRVEKDGFFLGYIPKEVARHLVPLIDRGRQFIAQYFRRNESLYHQTLGLGIRITDLIK